MIFCKLDILFSIIYVWQHERGVVIDASFCEELINTSLESVDGCVVSISSGMTLKN